MDPETVAAGRSGRGGTTTASAARWERFAQEDPKFFIWGRGSPNQFFGSGESDADRILGRVAPHLAGREVAIEIGSGVGRLALPMARRFRRVLGVDVSPTMLSKLQGHCAMARISNVTTALIEDPWPEAWQADLVYSWTVLQHVESATEVDRILGKVSRSLRPSGVAFLHFDTRPAGPLYRLRGRVPDRLLPTTQRASIRRIRRRPAELREAFERNGMTVVAEENLRSDWTFFVLRRSEGGALGGAG
jgi:SAM-dependent methyltransferase